MLRLLASRPAWRSAFAAFQANDTARRAAWHLTRPSSAAGTFRALCTHDSPLAAVMAMKVSEIKAELAQRKIKADGIFEKEELAQLLLASRSKRGCSNEDRRCGQWHEAVRGCHFPHLLHRHHAPGIHPITRRWSVI